MRFLFVFALLFFFMPGSIMAQKKNRYNEGSAPKVKIYQVGKDSLMQLSYLPKDRGTRIKVVLEGGIENIKNTVFVTSKQAIITKDTSTKDEYVIVPQKESCEIIVDVKTFEIYYAVKETETNGKKRKEIVKEYPPKTYMVGYERYEVR